MSQVLGKDKLIMSPTFSHEALARVVELKSNDDEERSTDAVAAASLSHYTWLCYAGVDLPLSLLRRVKRELSLREAQQAAP